MIGTKGHIKLYPKSRTMRLLSLGFLGGVIFFIWMSFQVFLTGEIAVYLGLEGLDEGWSTFQVLMDIIFFLTSVLLIKVGRIRLTKLGHLLSIFATYIIIQTIFTAQVPSKLYLINLCLAASGWIFLYFGWKGIFYGIEDDEIAIQRYVPLCFIYCSVLFLFNYIVTNSMGLTGYHYIEVNFILTLFPFLTLLRSKKQLILLIIASVILVLLSAKRASSVALVLTIFFYIVYYGRTTSEKVRTVCMFSVIGLITLIIIYQVFPDNLNYMFERFSEIEEDGGSGRDQSYASLLSGFFDQKFFHIIFGGGFNHVKLADLNHGYSAHNDFLEVAYDYGILGFLMYIGIYIKLLNIARNKYLGRRERIACKLSILIFLFLSMTSHLILYYNTIIWLVAIWAYLENNILRAKIRKKIILKIKSYQ